MRNGLLRGRILDFGCGLGADTKGLQAAGFDVEAYDPYYKPKLPDGYFDTIICQYVINVLEEKYQEQIILEMSSKLAPGGSVFITVRRDVRYQGYRTHKIHQKTTYQRNVLLNFPSVYVNDFCEIYQIKRKVDHPVKSACIFCRPSNKLKYIAESSHAFAVYDGYPVSKRHA